jgi:D-aminoacyl-tRNA deacylase
MGYEQLQKIRLAGLVGDSSGCRWAIGVVGGFVMRCVVQRVLSASVTIQASEVGSIGIGLCAFVGVGIGDAADDARALADKLVELRIFEDEQLKMNRSVVEVGGAVLMVSQFTLFGDTRRGRRPSFTQAMQPGRAEELFDRACECVRQRGVPVATGQFRADMQVHLVNDGPVTLLIDTAKQF